MLDVQRIGKMIRFHRKTAGISQAELAKLSGIGKTTIFDLERGKETIGLSMLIKILKTLNISIQFDGPLMNLFKKDLDR